MYRRRRSKNETVLVCDYLNRRRHFLIFLNCSKIKSKKLRRLHFNGVIQLVDRYHVAFTLKEQFYHIFSLSLVIDVCSCCSLFYYLGNMRALSFFCSHIRLHQKFLKNVHYFKNIRLLLHTHKEKSPRDEMKSFLYGVTM